MKQHNAVDDDNYDVIVRSTLSTHVPCQATPVPPWTVFLWMLLLRLYTGHWWWTLLPGLRLLLFIVTLCYVATQCRLVANFLLLFVFFESSCVAVISSVNWCQWIFCHLLIWSLWVLYHRQADFTGPSWLLGALQQAGFSLLYCHVYLALLSLVHGMRWEIISKQF